MDTKEQNQKDLKAIERQNAIVLMAEVISKRLCDSTKRVSYTGWELASDLYDAGYRSLDALSVSSSPLTMPVLTEEVFAKIEKVLEQYTESAMVNDHHSSKPYVNEMVKIFAADLKVAQGIVTAKDAKQAEEIDKAYKKGFDEGRMLHIET
jgi:pterin-4a-carbinolamine dehydratase